MFIEIHKPNTSIQPVIVDELSDYLFEEGWRIKEFIDTITGNQLHKMEEDRRQFSIQQYGF